MAAELSEQAVRIAWKGGEITVKALLALIRQMTENRGRIRHGRQSLSRLNLQGKQLEQLELAGEDMKSFRRELNRYAVDFSVMQDRASGNRTVFFKGQDVDRVYAGLQKCAQWLPPAGRRPVREALKDAAERAAQRAAERREAPGREKSADRSRGAR
ncbi:MAG: PcfB family protein [Clostridium sp.]|jgi:hypothetical protein|nr:PcfB family protein [Clostridium sp.]